MLMKSDQSLLLVIDVQEKLMPAVHESKTVTDNIAWLINVARQLDVPMLVSQQYPKGLGQTVPELATLCEDNEYMDKLDFSCAAAGQCRERIEAASRDQVVIAGIEAHVCVLQSAIGLREAGYQVFVAQDAVSSRQPADVTLAMGRLRGEGVTIVNREMCAFEWLQRAGTDAFRHISKNYLR